MSVLNRLETIAHATDLQEGSETVFAHALALAAASGARLYSFHARVPGEEPTITLPDAEVLLKRWGREGATRHELRILECCDDAVDTLLPELRPLDPDLIVAGRRHEGGRRLLHRNVGTALARNLRKPALFLSQGAPGFVEAGTGAFSLHRVLVPVAGPPEARVALTALATILEVAETGDVDVVLLHVGDDHVLDQIEAPVRPGVAIHRKQRAGKLEPTILAEADEMNADLIVMATHPRDGLLEQVRGTHTEHVSGRTTHAVLSVPLEA